MGSAGWEREFERWLAPFWVAPDDYAQVHHFVCTSCWDPVPLERVLAAKAQAMVGGRDAVLIVDDTALLKKGARSVGVARQYAGAAGKLTNCQTLVSLTLARAIKARWSCEQAHQQLKEELGLDHLEGRTWAGLHHHALVTMISFAFLQHLRLGEARRRGENQPGTRRAASAPDPAGHPPRARRGMPHGAAPLPDMPRATGLPAAGLPAARVDVAM